MKYIEEFRDLRLAQDLAGKIRGVVKRPIALMEVCGSHTVSIFRHGIRDLLPPTIRLLSGPGCPVCVTAIEDIDKALTLARTPGIIFSTFGDMLRIPGSGGSLQEIRAQGSDIRLVYSPLEALELASANPTMKVVFFAVGFETTSPLIAATLKRAISQRIRNFYIFSVHKLVPPALKALVSSPEVKIDGFILPGHVSAIIGTSPYRFLADEFHVPAVISGFEPLDILQSIWMLVKQVERGGPQVEIQYRRVVSAEGNPKALELLGEVFVALDDHWRGLGLIPQSGLKLKAELKQWDAEANFDLPFHSAQEHPGCQCGDVLRGAISPNQCDLFSRACTPENPLGPCMVSTEGACSAHYRYGLRSGDRWPSQSM